MDTDMTTHSRSWFTLSNIPIHYYCFVVHAITIIYTNQQYTYNNQQTTPLVLPDQLLWIILQYLSFEDRMSTNTTTNANKFNTYVYSSSSISINPLLLFHRTNQHHHIYQSTTTIAEEGERKRQRVLSIAVLFSSSDHDWTNGSQYPTLSLYKFKYGCIVLLL